MRQAPPHHPLARNAPWLLLLLLPPIVFWRVVFFRGVFFILDTMILNHPLRAWCVERLRAGQWPLWCPEIACGWPVFAEGQAGVLYLPNWPFFALLEPHFAISFSTVFHLGLAGIFIYGYLRSLHISRAAALFGALSFQWSGFLIQRALFLNLLNALVWLPVLCWLTERWRSEFTGPAGSAPRGHDHPDRTDRVDRDMRSRRRTIALLTTGAMLMSILAGHPQAAAYSLIFWAVYTFCRLVPRSARRGTRFPLSGILRSLFTVRFVVPLILIPVVVGGLAAVQLVPTMELTAESMRARAVTRHLFMLGSLPPEKLATFILPGYFGSPADGTYWAWDTGPRWEMDAYTGFLPLVFALLALVAVRRSKDASAGAAESHSPAARHHRRPFPITIHAAAALVALLLSMGKYTPLGILVYHTPLFNHFRIPARFMLVFAFSVAVLAAYGLHAVLEAVRERWAERNGDRRGTETAGRLLFDAETTIRGFRRLAVILALAFACLFIVVALANGLALFRPAGLLSGRSALFDMTLAVGSLAAVVLLLAGSSRWTARLGHPGFVASVIILLTMIDLGVHGRGAMPVISPEAYTDTPETVRLIRDCENGRLVNQNTDETSPAEARQRSPFRVAGLVSDGNSSLDWHSGWLKDRQSYRRYFSTLHMYGPATFGLETICFDGWSPLHLRRYRELNRILDDRLYDLLGVRYLTVPAGMTPTPAESYEPLLEEVGFRLYRNHDPLPRAWLVHRAEVIPDLDGSLRRLGDPLFDPRFAVILDADPSAGGEGNEQRNGPPGGESVTIERYTDRLVEIRLNAGEAGYLVLSDTWYPGWEAFLDGRPVPLLRADQAFRAVRVPKGGHRVSFCYRPKSLVLGFWITALSGLLLLPLTVWAAGRWGSGDTYQSHGVSVGSSSLLHRRWGRWLALALLGFLLLSVALQWPQWKASWKALTIPEVGSGAARANWETAGLRRPGGD